MALPGLFQASLLTATLLCSLVAGFLFAFAAVVMPGIRRLDDAEFIRAFQAVDGVIQDSQPVFMLVWVGSVLALLGAAATGLGRLAGIEQLLLIGATLVYLLGVQLPTIAVNVPLNDRLQALDVDALGEAGRGAARGDFESRWNRWNVLRSWLSILTATLLIVLLFML